MHSLPFLPFSHLFVQVSSVIIVDALLLYISSNNTYYKVDACVNWSAMNFSSHLFLLLSCFLHSITCFGSTFMRPTHSSLVCVCVFLRKNKLDFFPYFVVRQEHLQNYCVCGKLVTWTFKMSFLCCHVRHHPVKPLRFSCMP